MPLPTAAAPDQVAVSTCLLDAHGQVLAADGPDRPFYAASTIKLHVLLTALRAAEGGLLDLTEEVTARRTFTGADGAPFTLAGDHLDPTHPAEGAGVSVRELLVRMIDRSSNEATDHVIALVGLDAVAETLADLELRATRVERLIGDASALAAGATNETSAGDLARTMRALVQPAGAAADGERPRAVHLSPASIALARQALRAQRIPVIARSLRAGVEWGSKSGWVDGYRHDVAFVGAPDSPTVRHLAVMTAGLAPEAADAEIAERTRALVADAC